MEATGVLSIETGRLKTDTESGISDSIVVTSDLSREHSTKLNFDILNGVENGEMDQSLNSETSSVPATHVEDASDITCERSEAVLKVSSPQPITKPSTPTTSIQHDPLETQSPQQPKLFGSLKRSFGKGKKKDDRKRKTPRKLFTFNKKKREEIENGIDEPETEVMVPEAAASTEAAPEGAAVLSVVPAPVATQSATLPGATKPHHRVHPARQSFGAGVQESEQEIVVKYQSSCVFFTPEGDEVKPKHVLSPVEEEGKIDTLPKRRGLTLPWRRRPHSTAEADVDVKPKKRRPLSFAFGQKDKPDTPAIEVPRRAGEPEAPTPQLNAEISAVIPGAGVQDQNVKLEPMEIGEEFIREETQPDEIIESSCLHFKADPTKMEIGASSEIPDPGGTFIPEEAISACVEESSVTVSDAPALFAASGSTAPGVNVNGVKHDVSLDAEMDIGLPSAENAAPDVTFQNAPPLFVEPDMQARLNAPEIDNTNADAPSIIVDIPKSNKKKRFLGRLSFNKDKPQVPAGEAERCESEIKVKTPTFEIEPPKLSVEVDVKGGVKSGLPDLDIDANIETPEVRGNVPALLLEAEPKSKKKGLLDKLSFRKEKPSVQVEAETTEIEFGGDVEVPAFEGLEDDITTPEIEIVTPFVGDVDPKVTIENVPALFQGEMELGEIEIASPSIDADVSADIPQASEDFDFSLPAATDTPLFDKDTDVREDSAASPEFDFKISDPDVVVKTPELNVDTDVNVDIPDLDGIEAEMEPRKADIDVSGTANVPAIFIPDTTDKKQKKKTKPGFLGKLKFKKDKPEAKVDVVVPSQKIEAKANVPDTDVDVSLPTIGVAGPYIERGETIDIEAPWSGDVDISPSEVGFGVKETHVETTANLPNEFVVPNPATKKKKGGLLGKLSFRKEKAVMVDLNIDAPRVDLKKPDIHAVDSETPNLDVEVDSPKVDIESSKVDVEVEGPEVDIETPEVDIAMPYVEVNAPIIDASDDFSQPIFKIKGSDIQADIDADLKKPDKDIRVTKPDIDWDIDLKKPELEYDIPKPAERLDIEVPDITVASVPAVDINVTAETDVAGPKIGYDPYFKSPELGLVGGVDFDMPEWDDDFKVDTHIDGTVPEIINEKESSPGVELEIGSPWVETKFPDIDMKLPSGNVGILDDVVLPESKVSTPDAKANIDVEIETKPQITIENVPAPIINASVDEPKVKKKKFNLKDKLSFGKDKPDLKVKVETPHVDIDSEKPDVDTPKIEIEDPEIVLDAEVKVGGDISLPKADIEGQSPEFEVDNVPAIFVGDDVPKKRKNKKPRSFLGKLSFRKKKWEMKADMDVELPKVDNDAPKDSVDLDVKSPEIRIDAEKEPADLEITRPHMRTPELDLNTPKVDVESPKGGETELNFDAGLPKLDLDLDSPKVDVESPSIDNPDEIEIANPFVIDVPIETPELTIGTPEADIKLAKPCIELSGVDVDVSSPETETDISVELPEIKGRIELPDVDVESSSLHTPEMKMPRSEPSFDIKGLVSVDKPEVTVENVPAILVEVEEPKKKKKPSHLGGFSFGKKTKPDIKVRTPDVVVKADAETPDMNVELEIPNFDVDGSKIELAEEIEIASPHVDVNKLDLGGDACVKGEVILPEVNVDNVPAFFIDEEKTKKKKKRSFLGGFSFGKKTKPEVKVTGQIDTLDDNLKVDANTPGIDVEAPQLDVDIEGPKVELGADVIEIASPYADVDKPDIGGEIDFSFPKSNIDIDVAKLDIDTKTPKLDIDTGVEGEGKIILPDVTVDNVPAIFVDGDKPKDKNKRSILGGLSFGKKQKPEIKMTGGQMETPDVEMKADVDTPDLDVDVEVPKLHLYAPKVDDEIIGPKVELDSDEIEISSPQVDIDKPDIGDESDLSLPEANLDIQAPKLNIDIEAPKYDADAGAKSNISLPEFTVDSVPAVFVDVDKSKKKKRSFLGSLSFGKKPKPEIQVSGQDGTPDVDLNADVDTPKVDVETPKIDADIEDPKIEIDSDEIEIASTHVDIDKPDIGGEIDLSLPKSDLDIESNKLDVIIESPKLDVDAGLKGEISSIDVTVGNVPAIFVDGDKQKDKKKHGIVSGFSFGKKHGPEIKVSGQVDTPDVDGMTDIDTPDAKVESPKLEVDVEAPKLDIVLEGPKLEHDADEIEIVSPHDDIDKPDIGGEIALQLPKADLDIGPKLDIDKQTPEMDVDDGIKGEISLPEVTVTNVPAVFVDVEEPKKTKRRLLGGLSFGKKPKPEIRVIGQVDTPDVDLKADVDTPEVDAEAPRLDVNIEDPKIELSADEIEIASPHIDVDNPDIGSEIDLSIPKADLDIEAPKLDVDIEAPKLDVNAESGVRGDTSLPGVSVDNVPAIFVDVDKPKNKKKRNFLGGWSFGKQPRTEIQVTGEVDTADVEVKSDGEIQDVDLEGRAPKLDVDVIEPKLDVDIEAPKVDVDLGGPKADIDQIEIASPHIDIDKPDLGGDNDLSLPKAELAIAVPKLDMDIETPKIDLDADVDGEGKINLPAVTVDNVPAIFMDVDKPKEKNRRFLGGFSFGKKPKPEIQVTGEVDTQIVNLQADVDTPKIDVDVEAPKLDIDLEGPKDHETPDVDLEGRSPKLDVDVIDPKVDVDIEAPKLDVDLGQIVDLDSDEIENSSPHIDIDKPDLGCDIDLSLPKADLDIEAPKLDIDLETPKFDIDAGVEGEEKINIPVVTVDNVPAIFVYVDKPKEKKMRGFLSRLSFGNKPKPEIQVTGQVDTPNVDLQAEVNTPKIDVDVEAPKLDIDLEGRKAERAIEEIEIVSPHVDIDKSDIDSEINLSLPKIDLNVEAPNLDFDVESPKVEESPDIKGLINLPEVTVDNVPAIIVDVDKQKKKKRSFLGGLSFGKKTKHNAPKQDVDVDAPKLDVDFEGHKVDLVHDEIEIASPHFDIEKPDIGGEIDLSYTKADLDIEAPKLGIDAHVEGDITSPEVTVDNVPSVFVDVKKPTKKKKRSFLGGLSFGKKNKPEIEIKSEAPKIGVETPKAGLGVDIDVGTPVVEIEKQSVEIEPKEIDIAYPVIDVNTSADLEFQSPSLKTDIDVNSSSVDVEAPQIDVSGPTIDIEMPKGDIDIEGPSLDIEIPKPSVDVEIRPPFDPSFDIRSPSADVELPSLDVTSSGPSVDIGTDAGLSLPCLDTELAGPEISPPSEDNSGLPKLDIDEESPHIQVSSDGDISAPSTDLDIAIPSVDVDIAGPIVDIDKPDLVVDIVQTAVEVGNVPNVTIDADVKVKKPKNSFLDRLSFRKEKPEIKTQVGVDLDVDLNVDAEATVGLPDDTVVDNVSALFIAEPVKPKKSSWKDRISFSKEKPGIVLESPKHDVDVEVAGTGVDITWPAVEVDVPAVDIPEPKFDGEIEITTPFAEPSIDIDAGVKAERPSGDIDLPSLDINAEAPEMPSVEASAEIPSVTVDNVSAVFLDDESKPPKKGLLGSLSFRKDQARNHVYVDVDKPDAEVKLRHKDKKKRKSWLDRLSFRKEKTDVAVSGDVDVDVEGPNLDADIQLPSAEIEIATPTFDVNVDAKRKSVDAGDIKLRVESEPATIELPSLIEGDFTGFVVPSPAKTIEVKAPETEVDADEKGELSEMPSYEFEIGSPFFELEATPENATPELSITQPSIEGGVELSATGKLDLPNDNIDISAEAPEVQVPQVEVEVSDVPALQFDAQEKPKRRSWLDRLSFRKDKPELVVSTDADIKVNAGAEVEVKAPSVSSGEQVVIEPPRIDDDLDLPELSEVDIRFEDVPAQFIESEEEKPKRRSWLDRLSFRKEDKPEISVKGDLETPDLAVEVEMPALEIDSDVETTVSQPVKALDAGVKAEIETRTIAVEVEAAPEIALDVQSEPPLVEITVEELKVPEPKVEVKGKSKIHLPKLPFKKKEKKPKSPKKKKGKKKKTKDIEDKSATDKNVIDDDKPPLFIEEEITSMDRDGLSSELHSLAGSPSRVVGPQGTSTPLKIPLKAPRLHAPLSIEEISPSEGDSDSELARKSDDEGNKTGTFKLYFANQSVRDEDKILPDTVVLPFVFDEYQTIYLYHPRDEESEWIEEKGVKKWMDHQKHRIFNILIKMKKRYDGQGLFLKFKYQDGLYGLQRTYYGDVHLNARTENKILSCCIFTETDIYIMELTMPPTNPDLNLLDGWFRREHIASGMRTYWEAAVHKHDAKRSFVQQVQTQTSHGSDSPILMAGET